MTQGFKGRDIISIHDFSREEIEHVLKVSKKMIPAARGEEKNASLKGKILSTIFFEPSTRTRLSFEAAMIRLGGSVVGFSDPEITSLKKGETLADTIRMVESYSDVIVLRHPMEGASKLAANFTERPVINAGDGAGQHPTQTLLDLFTIWTEKKKIENNNIVLLGDLKYGRTVHSLASALALFGANLTFVAPDVLQMPKEILDYVSEKGASYKSSSVLEDAIESADVLYVTRIQRERFPDAAEYEKVAGAYRVDNEVLSKANKDIIVMHPLPRVKEIAPEVDITDHALYFKQAFNGVPVRMALMALIFDVVK
jgi:aspartate carbamoyltransferase catalytic subunit